MPKLPSPLGVAIELAVEARFIRHCDPVQYLATFRTSKGTVFAMERVTQGHINLWLPEQDEVRREAERAGLSIERTVAWANGRAAPYGRISSLKTIPMLRDEPLFRVRVSGVDDALKVLEKLS